MRKIAVLFGCLLIIAFKGVAQSDTVPSFRDTLEAYEGLFRDTEPLHLTLEFDIRKFQRTRRHEKYQPVRMTCQVNDTFSVVHPARVKARGSYRRDNCVMPPFWLNIRYSGIETPELEGVKRMKMVVRCRNSSQYDAYILREYLVYRIYEIVSPYSFRTRLVRLRLVDTGRKGRITEDWAFLIEPEEMLARRLGGEAVKTDRLAMATVNQDIMDLLAMFQYMIGNGDYSVTGRQNLKIITLTGPGPSGFIPVPYDFDYTGLVNTHYAIPGKNLGINSVRERYYLGRCTSRERYLNAIGELESCREEINRLVLDFEFLNDEEKMDMVAFIQSFYNEAGREKFIDREITSTCR